MSLFSSIFSSKGKMTTVSINGKVITCPGGVIGIDSSHGKIIINGVEQASGLSGEVTLKIDGGVANITADGSVHCQNVKGDVKSGGSVHCENVEGNVSAGGSVKASKVGGSMRAGGSVKVSS